MKLEVSLQKNTFILQLQGNFDTTNIQKLETKINKLLLEEKNILVNLRQVSDITNEALNLFLLTAKRLTIIDRGLCIYTPHKNHLIQIQESHLDSILPIFYDLDKALAFLP